MSFLNSLNIVGSGMTAQQTRLDVISENITNVSTTRTEEGGAYRRKMVVMESQGNFQAALARAQRDSQGSYQVSGGGVAVTAIQEDPSDLKLVYDPTHPDANEAGYVELPNVDMVKEMTDAMAASQAFSANVTVFNTLKGVIAKGLEIGK